MKFAQIHRLIDHSDLSPEQLSAYFGTSNMTIRRWQRRSPSSNVSVASQRSIIDGVYRLLSEGRIHSSSPDVQELLNSAPTLSFEAALADLGMQELIHKSDAKSSDESDFDYGDRVVHSLSKIGMSDQHRSEVDHSQSKLQAFKKLSKEWCARITTLWNIVRSKKLTVVDKFVAYGALFYLICPFDLIPDHIPVVGLLDDYAVLGFAVAYYMRKFPKLINVSGQLLTPLN